MGNPYGESPWGVHMESPYCSCKLTRAGASQICVKYDQQVFKDKKVNTRNGPPLSPFSRCFSTDGEGVSAQ